MLPKDAFDPVPGSETSPRVQGPILGGHEMRSRSIDLRVLQTLLTAQSFMCVKIV